AARTSAFCRRFPERRGYGRALSSANGRTGQRELRPVEHERSAPSDFSSVLPTGNGYNAADLAQFTRAELRDGALQIFYVLILRRARRAPPSPQPSWRGPREEDLRVQDQPRRRDPRRCLSTRGYESTARPRLDSRRRANPGQSSRRSEATARPVPP